ncbi:hypothetical protein BU23DRAFT_40198 [Bimuria novae-zelandiae CBS 107.79]|uniref:Uncharacterized protein n=1 Tax=Bimuria novae-zelandiae CBS 107.79 TaxID=1447943 RepID=A0A6A5UVC0_9PLEO|nr:hypothetical protein BU23DRAFT_40198 [Bimuria novae-zelandiae CBS 107.79]
MLPLSLWLFLGAAWGGVGVASSPSPPFLTNDSFTHLVPRHTLFFRQAANLQSFQGTLGGTEASPITQSGDSERPFSVDGDTFPDFDSAAQRSCDNQAQKCKDKANSKGKKGKRLEVGDCDAQRGKCLDAQKSATVKDFQKGVASVNIGKDESFPDFDLICDA